MSFSSLRAQSTAVETLTRALKTGRIHHAYRFEGPEGVGKGVAAAALAQALVCEKPSPLACETCSSCQRAVAYTETAPRVPRHPDIVILERGLYPPKLLGLSHTEATGISVEQVRRLVLGRVGLSAHEQRALVFIIRRADELTEQASNALLKTLEEPGPRVHFILLTSRPYRLSDTVRSRTLPVRFGPLPDDVVASLLSERGLDAAVAPLAAGSATLGFALAEGSSEQNRRGFVDRAVRAIDAPDLSSALRLMERPESRDGLRAELAYLAHSVAERAKACLPDSVKAASRWAFRHEEVLGAMSDLERGQPLLVLERLICRLREC